MANVKNIPVQEAADRHAAGESLRSLARVYGVDPMTLSRKLKASGFEVRSPRDGVVAFNVARPPSLDLPPREELERLYASGHSLYSLGDMYGVSPSTIKKWMKRYELPRRPTGEATRSANLRRPQGNGSRGGGGYVAHAAAIEKTRQKRLALVRAHRVAQGCQRCGINHPAVLDLHHLDRAEKHRMLRTQGAGRSRTRGWADVPLRDLDSELAKCDVLCSNCHRITEWEARQPTT